MKSIANLTAKFAFLLIPLALIMNRADAQNKKQERDAKQIETIKKIMESKAFVFEPDYMKPLRGGGKTIVTDEYRIRVNPDSLFSILPYIGQAFNAPYNGAKDELDFMSTDFEYYVVDNGKGGWDVTIVPRDHRELRKMLLSVLPDGKATLHVTSNNRDAISYTGTIEPTNKG